VLWPSSLFKVVQCQNRKQEFYFNKKCLKVFYTFVKRQRTISVAVVAIARFLCDSWGSCCRETAILTDGLNACIDSDDVVWHCCVGECGGGVLHMPGRLIGYCSCGGLWVMTGLSTSCVGGVPSMALCNATRYTCMPVRACLYHHCVLHQLTLSSCLSCQ